MLVQTRLDKMMTPPQGSNPQLSTFSNRDRGPKFTLVVPSNEAWEKAQMNFHKAYNTLLDGQFPQYTVGILQRHLKIGPRAFTFEELTEMTRSSPRRAVDMMNGGLEFNQLGQFELSKLTIKRF